MCYCYSTAAAESDVYLFFGTIAADHDGHPFGAVERE